MKDETKEILKYIQKYTDEYETTNLTEIRALQMGYVDTVLLLNYITNLQEENEYSDYCNKKLREKITNLEYKITTLEDYKTRNEKAIEKCINKQYETNAPWLIKFAKDIENILQGKE